MGVTSKDGSDGSEGSEGKEGGSDRVIAEIATLEQIALNSTQPCAVAVLSPYQNLHKSQAPMQIFSF